jgi:hypothetical protein
MHGATVKIIEAQHAKLCTPDDGLVKPKHVGAFIVKIVI